MSELYPVPDNIKARTLMDEATYQRLYNQSVDDPDSFWAEQASNFLSWEKSWHTVSQADLPKGNVAWFEGAQLNVSTNCIDRHLPERADQTAIIWEGDDPADDQNISYQELYDRVCQLANGLRQRGVSKGDRVCIYMPMIPEAAYAMLACARIGAIHSVVFGGFSPQSLKDRILDSDCQTVITADEGVRGGKAIPLKANTDEALQACPNVHTVVTVKRTGGDINWVDGRDVWYDALTSDQPKHAEAEVMESEDPLFILYTSGSTGKPKGVQHSSAGYLLHAAMTHKYVFDYQEGDIYWCTADVGWITGHSYIVYGPLANGATTLMFEGVPTYPDASRCWQVIDKHQVNVFYTAPTALRQLMAQGDDFVNTSSRSTLHLLGSVGEPINPEAWEWYHRVVGEGRCPIVDTWWQTETGGVMISPLPGATPTKPGSTTLPLPGIQADIIDAEGKSCGADEGGYLAVRAPWPGMMRTVHGNPQRFRESYWEHIRPADGSYLYFAGDGARRDADGYFWVMGRVDDVINVSGHRLGTMEIESALVSHPAVAEAAVVGRPDDIKGEGIVAFVTLEAGREGDDALVKELRIHVGKEIGPIARPDEIRCSDALPKTRSGKIMRRILRALAAGQEVSGDTSTLEDRSVLDRLRA